ncbi:MAG TPA: phosphotransferase [Lysobacter sp.]|nr:phosphotransferase [Lysobacter sp.]
MTPAASLERETTRLTWARTVTGNPTLELHRASVDAGFRSYWRGNGLDGTVIVMDSPPELEDPKPWLHIRDLLDAADVRVPGVLARDVDAGFLLLEDLGADTYLHVINTDNADALFDDAVTQLLKIQAMDCPADILPYDAAFLARELHLFEEWFLGRHLGITLDYGDMDKLELVYRRLIENAQAQAQVFVHRDFMPRNLMPVVGGPAVIDFQGALQGPIAYDAISLYRDAFLSWPEERVERGLRRYHERAVAAALPVPAYERFRRDADWIGMQRHLKILGIFARLHYRDGKAKYLPDAPRFIGYLDTVLARYPELAPLADILDRYVRPALQERTHA